MNIGWIELSGSPPLPTEPGKRASPPQPDRSRRHERSGYFTNSNCVVVRQLAEHKTVSTRPDEIDQFCNGA
jgi:hypothetical protein